MQYNTDSYELQGEIIVALLQTLDIAPQALNIPDINRAISGLCKPYSPLEIFIGLTVSEADGGVCLKVNKHKGKDVAELFKMLSVWKEQVHKLFSEKISREEYDNWRYRYLKFVLYSNRRKLLSQKLNDAFRDKLKIDD